MSMTQNWKDWLTLAKNSGAPMPEQRRSERGLALHTTTTAFPRVSINTKDKGPSRKQNKIKDPLGNETENQQPAY